MCGPCGRAQAEGRIVLLGEGVLGVGSVRRETRPAWFFADESGRKCALHAQNTSKRGHFARAERVLYRKWGRATRAGRVLSRRGTALVSCCQDFVARCAAAILAGTAAGPVASSALVAVGVLHL